MFTNTIETRLSILILLSLGILLFTQLTINPPLAFSQNNCPDNSVGPSCTTHQFSDPNNVCPIGGHINHPCIPGDICQDGIDQAQDGRIDHFGIHCPKSDSPTQPGQDPKQTTQPKLTTQDPKLSKDTTKKTIKKTPVNNVKKNTIKDPVKEVTNTNPNKDEILKDLKRINDKYKEKYKGDEWIKKDKNGKLVTSKKGHKIIDSKKLGEMTSELKKMVGERRPNQDGPYSLMTKKQYNDNPNLKKYIDNQLRPIPGDPKDRKLNVHALEGFNNLRQAALQDKITIKLADGDNVAFRTEEFAKKMQRIEAIRTLLQNSLHIC
jgi:hypothetical protein